MTHIHKVKAKRSADAAKAAKALITEASHGEGFARDRAHFKAGTEFAEFRARDAVDDELWRAGRRAAVAEARAERAEAVLRAVRDYISEPWAPSPDGDVALVEPLRHILEAGDDA
ncbi:hypothetical protein C1N80_06275 [Brachybacterium sp. SGAir0954]|uniref:hypothetical protein n=1 Tax=Brachybacterium sp. SGAir0954 TaxID=2571029 RepID=UPI0010CCC8FA|nr:hypothetical protein [Brachybacterium sp. SGAir0954]QCR53226.1 hypothetical protein C1N80_06275 [Brachybacterium sp. SGAir0954]